MKIRVDAGKCQGHGMCNAVAPEVFPLDDVGFCHVEDEEVPVSKEAQARRGQQACPERAIELIEVQ